MIPNFVLSWYVVHWCSLMFIVVFLVAQLVMTAVIGKWLTTLTTCTLPVKLQATASFGPSQLLNRQPTKMWLKTKHNKQTNSSSSHFYGWDVDIVLYCLPSPVMLGLCIGWIQDSSKLLCWCPVTCSSVRGTPIDAFVSPAAAGLSYTSRWSLLALCRSYGTVCGDEQNKRCQRWLPWGKLT